MKTYRVPMLLLVAQMVFLAAPGGPVNAAPLETIIYQDGFTVDGVERQYGTDLNLTTIEGSAMRWAAPSGMEFANINGGDVVRAAWGNSLSAVIDADLALLGGTVKIETDVMPLGTAAADTVRNNWVAIGFQPGGAPAGFGTAGLWMLFRGNGGYQIFRAGTSVKLADSSVPGYPQGQVASMSITYNSSTNTATFVIDGKVIYTSGDLGAAFASAAKRPFVTTYDGGQYIDNYTVSMEGGTLPSPVSILQSPANNAYHVDTLPELSWATVFGVPEASSLSFDVYLDPNEPPVTNLEASALESSQSGFRYTPGVLLKYETVYYWRIVTKVDGVAVHTSQVQHFLTDSKEKKWSDAPWMTDAELGVLSTGKVYTHKVKFWGGDENYFTSVLGIDFENDTDKIGDNWSLSGAGSTHDGSTFFGSGEGVMLDTRFRYGSPATLTLTGLTPGEEYRTTFYTHGWGVKGTRWVDITTSDDGKTRRLDENVGGDHRGQLFMYTYAAPESGELTFQFNAVGAGSWHHYAFTNEVVTDLYLDPTPVSWWAQVPRDVDLSWQLHGEVAGQLSYHLSIAADPNMDDLVVDTDLSENSYPADLTGNMMYYWQVTVMEDGVPVHESPVWNFETYEIQKWFDASWMTDDDLDLSNGKVYTHKVKFNAATEDFPTTVLGIDFENDNNRSGANWLLSGTPIANAGTHFTGTGEGAALNTRFFYSTPSALTLTGLTPGVEYRTTLYTHGWGGVGGRRIDILTSDDGRIQRRVDENIDGDGRGHLFMYYYTAPESGELTFDFIQTSFNATWHHYAFSNEEATDIYLDPTPVPGAKIGPEVNFQWQLNGDVADASYNLLVATDPNMNNVVYQKGGLTDTQWRVNLDPEVSYWWRVVVKDGDDEVHTSPAWDFVTSPPPDAEKVLEWTMDESSGPIAYQTGSSEDADGLLTGFNDPNASSMFVTGLVGNAVLLNGTTEYVDISDAYPYMPTGNEQAFAVSGYFRTFKPYGPIFSMRNSANGTPLIDISIGHDGARESAGRLRMLVRDDGGVLSPSADSGILVNDGRWHSFVVMRSRGNWALYVDGIKRSEIFGVASGAVTLDWLTIGTEKMWVFASYGSWNGSRPEIRYFEGMLDEVCVWAGEMQPHQIAALAAKVPPVGDLDFDLNTDAGDLRILSETWLADSYTPVQPSPVIIEDMESYNPADPNTYAARWEALNGGVSLENVYGNVDTAPTDATVGQSFNSIVDDPDGLYGQVLRWDYDLPTQRNVIQRFWLRDQRLDLAAYDHISIRVKKLPGSTGESFYFDFHDGRGFTDPEHGIYPWVFAWKGRIIMPLANLPEGQWVTLEADIPGGFNSGRIWECHDLYEVSIGVSRSPEATAAYAGTILIDEIVLSDSTTSCVATVGELLPDANGDCLVNIRDFAVMAENWLMGL